MIVCTNCGFHNEDDDQFCGGCQEFLDWTGEAQELDEHEEEGTASDSDEEKGLVERVVDRFSGPEDEPAAGGDDGAADTSATGGTTGADAAGATAIAADAARKAEERAEEAARSEEQARRLAGEQEQAAEQAEREAEAAERAKAEATAHAEAEAARLEELRAELESASTEPDEPEHAPPAAPDLEADAGADAAEADEADSGEGDDGDAELDGESAEDLLAELEAAEQAAREAEEAERAEAEAAKAARRAAEGAERARREAAEKAEEEARAAEQARRAAALVARPQATPTEPASGSGGDDRGRGAGDGAGPGPSRPAQGRKPRRRWGRKTRTEEDEPAEPSDDEGPSGPTAVKPDVAKARRVAANRPAPTRKLRPGDRVCGNCGEGNSPDRNFCRRCGDDLAETEVVRVPWWKRPFVRQPPPPPPAGTRPGGAGGGSGKGRDALKAARGAKRGVLGSIGKVTRVIGMVAIAAGGLGIAAVPSLRSTVTDRVGDVITPIRQFIRPEYEPVVPTAATASSALEDHPPELAINDTSNRWWAEGADGNGEDERLIVEFPDPVSIAIFGITPGAPDENFVEQPRPRLLHLVFDNGVTMDVDVVDEHEFQTFDVEGAEDVTSVEIQVIDVWQGQSGSDMAITSVEFRTLR